MPNYRINNYAQITMVPVNFQDQLQPGTFEYTLHHLIEDHLDLSTFDADYRNDVNGRHAYHPKVLLKILLFAYSKGILSSREIAWCCETNITFMALSCLETPHWTTIASFVTGPGSTTLPVMIYSRIRTGMKPDINALATIIIVTVAIGVIVAAWIMFRQEKQKDRDMQMATAANK